MKEALLICVLILFSLSLYPHETGHGVPLKNWKLKSNKKTFKANFVKYDKDEVWLINSSHQILTFKFSDFSPKDQQYITTRHEMILLVNTKEKSSAKTVTLKNAKNWLLIFGLVAIALSVFLFFKKKTERATFYSILGIVIILILSCKNNNTTDDIDDVDDDDTEIPANDVTFLKSIFESFTDVSTFYDDTYFYIASNGLPDHEMMVGITNWQQQVPINIDYTGDNTWAIPLQPKLAEDPLSTQTNLLKGAIAIGANGIPIFNPLNNRGEDANDIGELDNWGGHCGRADDYHYHLPPTHLQSTVGDEMPIAYALDGFPIYGETDEELDEYLGRFNEEGSYQYHTIATYPYFIAGMRGEVVLDPNTTAPENQIIPQASTQELRPALTPLVGASIVSFESTGNDAYSLSYTLNSETYMVNYNWDATGLYTYEFVNPDGTIIIETYQK